MRPTRPTPPVTTRAALAVLAALALGGCGQADLGTVSDGTSLTADADHVVQVTSTDDACEVPASVPRGAVAFVVTNHGSRTASFSVYSDGIDAIGQVRGIEPGQTRTLLLDSMIPGPYVAACTPGDDDDIRHDIDVVEASG